MSTQEQIQKLQESESALSAKVAEVVAADAGRIALVGKRREAAKRRHTPEGKRDFDRLTTELDEYTTRLIEPIAVQRRGLNAKVADLRAQARMEKAPRVLSEIDAERAELLAESEKAHAKLRDLAGERDLRVALDKVNEMSPATRRALELTGVGNIASAEKVAGIQ